MEKMSERKLPYIDEQGQLHYEAYVGTGRAILRESLPKDHPEYLFNYLEKHGIDWKLYFEHDGRRKGINHECGPVEKLLGKKKFVRHHTSIDEIYTRSDMERAFAGGGANAAKERVWKKDGLCLPILDFDKWLEKYEKEKEEEKESQDPTIQAFGLLDFSTLESLFKEKLFGLSEEKTEETLESLRKEWKAMDRMEREEILDEHLENWKFLIQARGRMYRKGQGTNLKILDITTNSSAVEEFKKYFIHEIPAEVLLLPTEKPSHIYELNGKLYFEEHPDKKVNAGNRHFYFLSNEKPEAGDWVYLNIVAKQGIFQVEKIESDGVIYLKGTSFCFESKDFKGKKIIATTDELTKVPQPKDSTLFTLIGYNTGRPVTNVAIEAEQYSGCVQCGRVYPLATGCSQPDRCSSKTFTKIIIDAGNTVNIAVK